VLIFVAQPDEAMSITIQLDLPEAVLEEARAKGLLRGEVLSELLAQELKRRQARENLGAMLKRLHSVTGDEMTSEEIQGEIDAVRAERRARREGGR
jgi:aminoglycoside phosphotransferase (APT) family kinase protein